MKSKAMVLKEFMKPLEMEEFEIAPLEAGEVLIKIEAAGVCGSDVHMWKGEDPRTPLPIILGHEGVGRIQEIKGKKQTVYGEDLQVGDLVIWNRGVTCGQCFACKILKDPSLCKNRKVYGINQSSAVFPYLNGCYSEYIILNSNTDIFKVEDTVDPALLVSASCSGATIAHAFDMISSVLGDTVVIQGPGPLGVYAVAFAKSMGASEIIVIGGSKERLDLCTYFGATLVLDRHETNIQERNQMIMEKTRGIGADLVVEAVGTRGVAEEGLKLLRSGGTYLSTGYAQPAGEESIDFYRDIVSKNITVHGVWVSDTKHTKMAIDIVMKNKEHFAKLISHRFSLEEANQAIASMNAREALKAVLIPNRG
ncbi:zinc-binding dehydrogenase [Clostridium formicaceticum]|uniref:5-exo-hydroxycamphor dehydrogenase n=1 Tax=Clostridium formicaceticum TaxID=1497 RepID=A0AAC9RKQ2_9CLOT|nr:zinc-binding dehydrogenase [Clostridium formicaceticum]AOY74524.1 alcohol dehydrogenase [Clostridium formicaceticum]ARE88879.1 5-exo-hydroxycamphor dehydrogenase [Clostridium formicaceticum]